MQSGSQIALPYSPSGSQKKLVKAKKNRRPLVCSAALIFSDLLVVCDALSVLCCGILSASLTMMIAAPTAEQFGADLIRTSVLGAILCPVVMRERLRSSVDRRTVKALMRGACMLVAMVLVVAIATRMLVTIPSLWVAMWAGSVVASALGARAAAAALLRWTARRFGGERIAIVGNGAEAEWLRGALQQAPGVDLVGPATRRRSVDTLLADLIARGRRGELDRVVLAMPGLANHDMRRIAHALKAVRIEVASLFPLLGSGSLQHTTDLADIPLFLITRRPQWGYGGLSKVVMDRCLALALLLGLMPVLLLVALAVRLDSPGPVLFRQRRHGVNGSEFDIFKFRTMVWEGLGVGSGAVQTGRRDRRVTRVGAFLRKSSLDEVPQLLNVLNGTMSLVGPRPHPTVMRTEERLGDEITPEYPHRHRVKPGITGWAQINGSRGATQTAAELRLRIEHDNYYIENWSPWLDLRILVMTPASLLFRRTNAF